VLTLVAALAANATVDVLQSGGDLGRFVGYTLDEARLIFLLSSGVVWLVLVALVALTGRLWLSVGVLTATSMVVGLASATKIELRQEPLYPSDLSFLGEAGFLTEMVGVGTVALGAGAVALVVLVAVLVGRVAARVFPPVRRRSDPRGWRRLLVVRLVALALSVSCLGYVAQFNEPGNRVRAAYEAAGAHWAFWFQQVNYARHGFVAGYLYNLDVPAMLEPPGYGPRTMARIGREYAAMADRVNPGRDPAWARTRSRSPAR
jgi:hypothetical protein